jgi:hypothetical protein
MGFALVYGGANGVSWYGRTSSFPYVSGEKLLALSLGTWLLDVYPELTGSDHLQCSVCPRLTTAWPNCMSSLRCALRVTCPADCLLGWMTWPQRLHISHLQG